MSDNLLTTNELCEKLKISRRTVLRMRKKGMPCLMLGSVPRYQFDKVLEWLETQQFSSPNEESKEAETENV